MREKNLAFEKTVNIKRLHVLKEPLKTHDYLKKLQIKTDKKTSKINPQEKKVLEKMLEIPGKVFSRNDIGKIINISKERTIDVMITRFRQKIETNPKNPKYLQTIRGSGYVLWVE